MATFDISKIKLTWKGQWRFATKYYKNDIVQWQDRTYRCILDTPDEFVVTFDSLIDTNQYQADLPQLKRATTRPDNTRFFTLFMPSNSRELWTWEMWRQYEQGDMVKAAGKLYMCTKRTRTYNTWVEESEYWTQIGQSSSGADVRNEIVSYANRAPLGWKYNMGSGNITFETNYAAGTCICSDGNLRTEGDYHVTGKGGRYARNGSSHFDLGGFTMTGWLNSTDNASWNPNATGRLTTPDGKAPRVIQNSNGWNTSGVLMNNGEVYTCGEGGNGELGYSSNSNRRHWIRAAAEDTVDWEGNTLEHTFNNTRIIKIAVTNQGTTAGAGSWAALDEFGHLWMWGYNGNYTLGFHQPEPSNTNNATSASIGFSTSANFNRPVRMPPRYFDHKRIVDIYAFGGGSGANFHALDEDGNLWGWGNLNNGGIGVGGDGDGYYMVGPRKVLMDWSVHGGIKKIMHKSHDNSESMAVVLTNDGVLWWAGYDYYGWAGNNRGTSGSSGYSTRFRRIVGEMWQGRVDNFWLMGDRQTFLYWTLKDDDKVWGVGDNWGYRLGSNSDNTYAINSGQGYKMPGTALYGPRRAKHMTMTGGGAYSTTSQPSYAGISILDENNDIWAAGENNYGGLGLGHGTNGHATAWQNEWNGPYYNLGDEYLGYTQYRRIRTMPGMKMVDVHGSGYGQYEFGMARDHRGRGYIAGVSGISGSGYESGQYNMWSNEYYRTTAANPGAYHAYQYHGGPSD